MPNDTIKGSPTVEGTIDSPVSSQPFGATADPELPLSGDPSRAAATNNLSVGTKSALYYAQLRRMAVTHPPPHLEPPLVTSDSPPPKPSRKPLPQAPRPTSGADLPESTYSSAFELPLLGDLRKRTAAGSTTDDSTNSSASPSWAELGVAHLSRVHKSEIDEAQLDKPSRSWLVEYWKEIIRDHQRANPDWLTQWLACYGVDVLEVLSDTQSEALLGVPISRLRQKTTGPRQRKMSSRDFRRLLNKLVCAQLCPARMILKHRIKLGQKHLNRGQLRQRILNPVQPQYSQSLLRQAYTPEDAERDLFWNKRLPPRPRSPIGLHVAQIADQALVEIELQTATAYAVPTTARSRVSKAAAWGAAIIHAGQASVVEAVLATAPGEAAAAEQILFGTQRLSEAATNVIGGLASIPEDDERAAASDDSSTSDTQSPSADNNGANLAISSEPLRERDHHKEPVALASEQTVEEDKKVIGDVPGRCDSQPSLPETTDSAGTSSDTRSTICSTSFSRPTPPHEPRAAQEVIAGATLPNPASTAVSEATSSAKHGLLTPPKNEAPRHDPRFPVNGQDSKAGPQDINKLCAVGHAAAPAPAQSQNPTIAAEQASAHYSANAMDGSKSPDGTNAEFRNFHHLPASAISSDSSPYDDTEYQQAKARMKRLAGESAIATAGPSTAPQLDPTKEFWTQNPRKRKAAHDREPRMQKKTRSDACDQKILALEATETTTVTVTPKKRKREDEQENALKRARFDPRCQESDAVEYGSFDGASDKRPRRRKHQQPQMGMGRPLRERISAPTEPGPADEQTVGGPLQLSLRPAFRQPAPLGLSKVNSIALPFRPRPPPSGDGVVGRPYAAWFPPETYTNQPPDRYEDGEVRRYGAGESYRPFNRDRSPPPPPRDIRSPLRDPSRGIRSPLRDTLRDRGRTPPLPGASDSYVPNRSPRRRSRSADRFRRERSRERDGGERWRRSRSRQRSPIRVARSPIRVARSPIRMARSPIRVARSPIRVARSPIRRPSPRRSPLRRSPPPRFVSPRRDDRMRSPLRRDFEIREPIRRRSRSPFDRLRRGRSPPRRSPPHGPRGGSYRPRSRSPNRRGIDDHYPGPAYRRPSPPLLRDPINTSMMNSRPASGISSPRPASIRGRDDRSGPQSPTSAVPPSREMPKPPPVQPALPGRPTQSTPKQPVAEASPAPARSPPRGPAALRVPPTGPAAARNLPSPAAPQTTQATRHPPPQVPSGPARPDTTSPTVPPAGPRGYVPPRAGSFASRGGRGSWSAGVGRHSISSGGQSVSPTVPPAGPSSGGGGGNSSGNSTSQSFV